MKDERDKAATEPTTSARGADAQAPNGSRTAVGYSVSLPEFDGPLDLLLSLIQEHELDILDIPIGFIATKYVEYITLMQQLNIDLASEYLVMAATLAHIKSKMLLPAPPEDQEEGDETELDPRAELVRRLLEYQKYRHVAEQLANRELLGRDVFVRAAGNPVPEGQPPLAPVTLFKLLEAFKRVLDRAHRTIDHQVQFERLSLTDRINELVDQLREQASFVVSSLFEAQPSRAELVVTLLALLEMTRLRMIRLTQSGPLEDIVVELAVSEQEAVLAAAAAAAAAGEGDRHETSVAGPNDTDRVSGESSEHAAGDSAPEPEGSAAEEGLAPEATPHVESPATGGWLEPSPAVAEDPPRDRDGSEGAEASMDPNPEQDR
ncbi:MAG: segregation/condensation protein A [Polyangiaceae bacterium]|nr:segregation/condensation protein A [Polyangiaceae bacterium]